MTTRISNRLFFNLPGRATWLGIVLAAASALAACSSDSGDGEGDGGSAGAGATAGSGGGTATGGSGGGTASGGSGGGTATGGSGGGSTCVSCDDGCPNIPCECQDGAIVNTTFCNNGCCEPAEIACPDACSDHGGWGSSAGGSGGGSSGGSGGSSTGGSGGGSSGNDIGGECQTDGDCLSNICLFQGGAAFGYCSKMCDSFADCPTFWDCGPVGNASGDYCIQGD